LIEFFARSPPLHLWNQSQDHLVLLNGPFNHAFPEVFDCRFSDQGFG